MRLHRWRQEGEDLGTAPGSIPTGVDPPPLETCFSRSFLIHRMLAAG